MMITKIEDYFNKGCGRCKRFNTPECSVKTWDKGLAELRRICLDLGLTETVKWGQPCYMHSDRNIVILGALKDEFRMTFFNGSLLKDPKKVLELRGPNTQQADIISFDDNAKVKKMKPVIQAYLKEAMGYAEAGVVPVRKTPTIDLPDELIQALDTDPELADAFQDLTPGRQRSYVLNLNAAKQSATRFSRIERFRDKIIAGKGATER